MITWKINQIFNARNAEQAVAEAKKGSAHETEKFYS
jgi:hypothetical protein